MKLIDEKRNLLSDSKCNDKIVSVVIPCFNEENYIEECILSLVKGDYKKIEILIVDGGSSDRSLSIINNLHKKYSNIKLLKNPKRITPISLNIGINRASGDYIMIASAHSQYPSNYISFLLHKLNEMECDVIGGSIMTKVKNSTTKTESIVEVLSNKFGVGNSLFRTEKEQTLYVDTVPFGIYKKNVFNNVGNYNERLVRNHDIELSKRIIRNGYKIVLVSSLPCVYYARESYWDLAKNNFSNGYWNLLTIYYTKDLRSLSLRHIVPLVFILSLIGPIAFSLIFSNYFIIIISLMSLMIYICFVFAISLKLLIKTDMKYIIWGFFTLHFSYGIGSFCGLFSIKKLFKA